MPFCGLLLCVLGGLAAQVASPATPAPAVNCDEVLTSPVSRLIEALNQSTYARWRTDPTLRWLTLLGTDFMPLTLQMRPRFQTVPEFLESLGIPPSQWQNYKQTPGTGRVQFNSQNQDYNEIPQAVRNSLTEANRNTVDAYRDLRSQPRTAKQLKKLLVRVHNDWNHLRPISSQDYFLLSPDKRSVALQELETNLLVMFPEIPQRLFLELRQEIEQDYLNQYALPKQLLIGQLKACEVDAASENWFDLGGIRLALVDYANLPSQARQLIELESRMIRANWKDGEREFDPTSTIDAVRAPFDFELGSILSHEAVIADSSVEFEPYVGPQVSHFRRQNGYSGKVIHLKVPGYLFQRHWQYDSFKPTIHSRFSFKTSRFTVEN